MFRSMLLTLTTYLSVISVVPAVMLLIALQRSQHCRQLFSTWVFYPLLNPLIKHAFEGLRREIMYELNDLVSHDPELRQEDAIRVLEVGVGSGRNLGHISRNVRFVAVDSNTSAKSKFLRRQSQYEHIQLEEWILASGEDLSQVPDKHVDAVIATHVLCSVADVRKLVSECRRVLAPGGKMLFIEHVACPRGSWKRQLQLLMDPLWQLLTAGCHLCRETSDALVEAGFREVVLKEVYLPILMLISRHIYGVATKGGGTPSQRRHSSFPGQRLSPQPFTEPPTFSEPLLPGLSPEASSAAVAAVPSTA